MPGSAIMWWLLLSMLPASHACMQPTCPVLHHTARCAASHHAFVQIMIRAGFTDAALDDEAKQLQRQAEQMASIDANVEYVLLLAAQVRKGGAAAGRLSD